LRSRIGSALIVVMWLLLLLAVIVAHFSREVRMETSLATDYVQREKAYYLAFAGVQRAMLQIANDEKSKVDTLEDEWCANPAAYKEVQVGKTGTYDVQVIDEDGKIDLNGANRDVLSRLLYAIDVERDQREEIVDSILDWRDPDDKHSLSGAEDDYYEDLDPPYEAKDGAFDSVEELLLVKGVTEDVYWGHGGEEGFVAGLVDLVTVYQTQPAININTAPGPVLEAVLGVGAATVEGILQSREEGVFFGEGQSPAAYVKENSSIPIVTASRNFSIVSTGILAEGNVRRTVRAVVSREKGRLELKAWDDIWERVAVPVVLEEEEGWEEEEPEQKRETD